MLPGIDEPKTEMHRKSSKKSTPSNVCKVMKLIKIERIAGSIYETAKILKV